MDWAEQGLCGLKSVPGPGVTRVGAEIERVLTLDQLSPTRPEMRLMPSSPTTAESPWLQESSGKNLEHTISFSTDDGGKHDERDPRVDWKCSGL